VKPVVNRRAAQVDRQMRTRSGGQLERPVEVLVEAHRPVAQRLGVVGLEALDVVGRSPPARRRSDAPEVQRAASGKT
jgi:hypothetical protein